MDEIQQDIAERIAHLLAESPLDEEIKQTLLNGLDKLPEDLVLRLLDSLEAERDELETVAFDIELFLKKQDAAWVKLEENQQTTANQMIEEETKTIEKDVDLQQARDQIQNIK